LIGWLDSTVRFSVSRDSDVKWGCTPETREARTQSLNVTVLHESWRFHPLTLIHYAEACSVADELRRAGYSVRLAQFRGDSAWDFSREPLLLRLSDSAMLTAVQALTRTARRFLAPPQGQKCHFVPSRRGNTSWVHLSTWRMIGGSKMASRLL
jgi:hypothetical protein